MARRDFTDDGSSDILWRNESTGAIGWWDMDRGVATWKAVGSAPPEWRFAGTGDYLGDNTPDLLWDRWGPSFQQILPDRALSVMPRHLAMWDVKAGDIVGYRDLLDLQSVMTTFSLSTTYALHRVTLPGQDDLDLDGNRRADMLVEESGFTHQPPTATTPSVITWDATTADIVRGLPEATTVTAMSGADWRIGAAGDVTGDGTADIVWRRGPYDVGVWIMQGGAPTGWASLGSKDIGTGYMILATADLTGDGTRDLLWFDVWTHSCGIWRMQVEEATLVARWADLGPVPPSFGFAGVGDYDGDGTEDILWRDAGSGAVGFWEMQDGAIAAWHRLPDVSGAWTAL